MPGTVRIVAQIHSAPGVALEPVQFFVDGTLLSTVSDGPPYAAEWVDENPFDPREITVTVTDALGNTARDAVRLKPLEVYDESQVTSVLVDATVQDKSGRFVRDLTGQDFKIFEDGVPQALDMAMRDEVGATFALLVDSSQSMANQIDLVRATAARISGFMRPRDRMLVVPFSKTLEPMTGPTNDRATVSDALGRIASRGGTAILDSLIELASHMNHLEGRRAIVLVTDGYDEHSRSNIEEAVQALKAAQVTVYVVGDRRRRGHFAEGGAAAEAARERDRWKSVLAEPRYGTDGRSRRAGLRRPEPISDLIYAVESGDRRFLADDQRAGVGSGPVGPRQTGIFCAEAGADSLLDRVHDHGQGAPFRGCRDG